MTYAFLWVVILITFILVRPIIGMFNLSKEAALIALMLTVFHAICTGLIRPFAFYLPVVFKAASDVKFTLVVSTVSMWVFRVALSFVLSLENVTVFGFVLPGAGLGIAGVWIAMMVDWLFRGTLYLIRYLSGKWLKKAFATIS